jgi:hypothetical protein
VNNFFQQLSSKKWSVIILLFWAVTIIFSWWFIPPKVDDGIYLIPSLSVLHNYIPGVLLGESVQPIFFIFPTQSFFHGIFLKILELLYFDININTYRLFNYLLVISLFYFTNKLFSVVFDNIYYQRMALNLTLILLGFSQFSLHFYVNRPEILGLVFFMLGLIYFIKFLRIPSNKELSIFLAFIYFGVSKRIFMDRARLTIKRVKERELYLFQFSFPYLKVIIHVKRMNPCFEG